MQQDSSQDCPALLSTQKGHSGQGTHALRAQIVHSLSQVVPSVPQTGFRSLGHNTKVFPPLVICVRYLVQSTWQNKDKLLWRSPCYARKVYSKLFVLYLSLNCFCNRTKPCYTEAKLQSEITLLNIILVLQESRIRTILEKRSFRHNNMYKIFISFKKKKSCIQ